MKVSSILSHISLDTDMSPVTDILPGTECWQRGGAAIPGGKPASLLALWPGSQARQEAGSPAGLPAPRRQIVRSYLASSLMTVALLQAIPAMAQTQRMYERVLI